MIDPRKALSLARRAVRRVARSTLLSGYGDDLVQETAVQLLSCDVEPGFGLACLFAARAHRRVFGDQRYRSPHELRAEILVAVAPAVTPCGALALGRLQQVWPTLTPLQQDALLTVFDADRRSIGEVAARHRSSSTAAIQARRVALERIDQPRSFLRAARRGVRGMSPEEARAYRRATSRRYRERRRQALERVS